MKVAQIDRETGDKVKEMTIDKAVEHLIHVGSTGLTCTAIRELLEEGHTVRTISCLYRPVKEESSV